MPVKKRPKGKENKVSIVIPTLNEERNLPNVLSELSYIRRIRSVELIIVDGYSRDKTAQIAKKAGAKVIFDRLGKGTAIVKGISAAKGGVVVIMDADCSHAASELPEMIRRVEEDGFDVAMGSRFMPGGGSGDITLLRFIGNKLFVSLVNAIWGTKYTDLCYGYRAFSKKAVREMSRLESKGFGIETEISILCAKSGLSTIEVPSYEKPRLHGESNLQTFRDGFTILKTIAKEIFSEKKKRS